MSLILEYLHKHGIDGVEIFASGGGDSGGVESVEFAANGQEDLPSDVETDLKHYLAQWADDYLEHRFGAWYNDEGGRGALKLWWDENGGKGELDFVEYYESRKYVILSNENEQALVTEFNCYLNQHPETAKWIKDNNIKFLEINIEYYSDNLNSPDNILIKAYTDNKESSFNQHGEKILRVLREFADTKFASQIGDIVKSVAYKHVNIINSASSYLEFKLNDAGLVETLEADLFFRHRKTQECGDDLDAQALLKLDNQLPPGLRAQMEKDLLEASVQQQDTSRAKRKKASMLGL